MKLSAASCAETRNWPSPTSQAVNSIFMRNYTALKLYMSFVGFLFKGITSMQLGYFQMPPLLPFVDKHAGYGGQIIANNFFY